METDKQQLMNELKGNPKVAAYLSKFEESSAERFLESYVTTKHLLLQYGEKWREWQLRKDDYFRDWAENHYWIIAEKKLFNLQCLWRAEQIDLPVAVAWEFQYWSRNIKASPSRSLSRYFVRGFLLPCLPKRQRRQVSLAVNSFHRNTCRTILYCYFVRKRIKAIKEYVKATAMR